MSPSSVGAAHPLTRKRAARRVPLPVAAGPVQSHSLSNVGDAITDQLLTVTQAINGGLIGATDAINQGLMSCANAKNAGFLPMLTPCP